MQKAGQQSPLHGVYPGGGRAVKIVEVPDAEEVALAVYHYYPSLDQVRAWLGEAALEIEEEGTGDGYQHFVVRKRSEE